MNNFPLFFLIFLFLEHGNSQIFKCCPENFHLNFIDIFNKTSFLCMKNNESFKNSFEFKGYDIEINDKDNIPDCDVDNIIGYIVKNDRNFLSVGSCVDVIDDNFYAVTCYQKYQKHIELKQVIGLQKCCPDDHTYDVVSRECIPSEFSEFTLASIVEDKSVGYSIGTPKCHTNDEVLVEYHSDKHGLFLEDSSIRFNSDKFIGSSDLLPFSNDFCLEKVYDRNNTLSNSSVEANLTWIAKVCMPRKICKHIPCVRKCCHDHEKLQRINGSTACIPHHAGINIQFFDQKGIEEIENNEGIYKFVYIYLGIFRFSISFFIRMLIWYW